MASGSERDGTGKRVPRSGGQKEAACQFGDETFGKRPQLLHPIILLQELTCTTEIHKNVRIVFSDCFLSIPYLSHLAAARFK